VVLSFLYVLMFLYNGLTMTCTCDRNVLPDNKYLQLSQLCVKESIVIRTFERYTKRDASNEDNMKN